MIKYPHFVKKYSELAGNRFTGMYMPDEDIEKLKSIFPAGCEYGSPTRYNICPEFYNATRSYEWLLKYDRISEFVKSKQALCWAVSNLTNDGYWVLWAKDGRNYRLACGKGKIKPNKHTQISLMAKVPAKVDKLFKQVWAEFVLPMLDVVESGKDQK